MSKKRFTKRQLAKYVKNDGILCPVCDNASFSLNKRTIDGLSLYSIAHCTACGCIWHIRCTQEAIALEGSGEFQELETKDDVVVTIRGGAVMEVESPGICVVIRDYDCDGADEENLKTDKHGAQYREDIFES